MMSGDNTRHGTRVPLNDKNEMMLVITPDMERICH